MASASNGTNNITFTYDANGLRHTKTVDGVVYTYYYAGDKLVRETFGSTVIDFFYDPDGRPYAMKYNGLILYYVLNQQGDVVRLIDSEGVNYGTYKYDAWGNILQKADTKYINNNPLRYRGYIYDPETGLYYLQSRYYDPVVGRFINTDSLVSTGQGILGNNMFAYCGNNPVSYADNDGLLRKPTTVAIEDGARGYFGGSFTSTAINSGAAFGTGILFSSTLEFIEEITASIRMEQETSTENGPYSVYVLIDGNNMVQYVGRTKCVQARKNAHRANSARKELDFHEVASNLSYNQARGLEQTLMLYYHTLNPDNSMNNQINGISIHNDNLVPYINSAERIAGYIWNQISNEVLCWAGI